MALRIELTVSGFGEDVYSAVQDAYTKARELKKNYSGYGLFFFLSNSIEIPYESGVESIHDVRFVRLEERFSNARTASKAR